MKVNKMITLDKEIVEKLQRKDNMSKLINDLLIEFFNKDDIEQMTEKELELYILTEKLKIKHKQELKEIMKNVTK